MRRQRVVRAANSVRDRPRGHASGLGAHENAKELEPSGLTQSGKRGERMRSRHPIPYRDWANVANNCQSAFLHIVGLAPRFKRPCFEWTDDSLEKFHYHYVEISRQVLT